MHARAKLHDCGLEFHLSMGIVDAFKTTCKNILGGPPGGAIVLVVVGASESLDVMKGTSTLLSYIIKGLYDKLVCLNASRSRQWSELPSNALSLKSI